MKTKKGGAEVVQKKVVEQEQRMEWRVGREEEVEKKHKSTAEERQQQEVEGWRREPQRELSQDQDWNKVESTGTGGDEKIGIAREAFEPRVRGSRGIERKKNNGGKTRQDRWVARQRAGGERRTDKLGGFDQDGEKEAGGATARGARATAKTRRERR